MPSKPPLRPFFAVIIWLKGMGRGSKTKGIDEPYDTVFEPCSLARACPGRFSTAMTESMTEPKPSRCPETESRESREFSRTRGDVVSRTG
jgi:hypothetical protein